MKKELLPFIKELGHEIKDFGPHSDGSVDYPDFAHPVAEFVSDHRDYVGLLICGSANGVAMAANKHTDIRAAICWVPELAELSRKHNNANILCLPGRFIDLDTAKAIVKAFIENDFEGGRHARRVGKINCY